MAPERLNGSNYSYGADIWHASLGQSGMRRGGMPQGVAGYHPLMRQRRSPAARQLRSWWLVIAHRSSPSPSPSPSPPALTLTPLALTPTLTLARSFGLIMLEMLLGKFPYPHQENYFRLLSLIMDEEVPSPSPQPSPSPNPNPNSLSARGYRATHTYPGSCTPSAWAPLAHRSCSTPAAPLQHPCSTPAAPLQHPCSTPAAPLQHPCSTPAAPLRCPCGAPAAPLQHPCSTPAAPLQHPCSTPAAPLQHPCGAPAVPLRYPGVLRCMPDCALRGHRRRACPRISSRTSSPSLSACASTRTRSSAQAPTTC